LLFVVVKLIFQQTKQRFEANKVNFKVLFSTMARIANPRQPLLCIMIGSGYFSQEKNGSELSRQLDLGLSLALVFRLFF
jgi:hypothetical protein